MPVKPYAQKYPQLSQWVGSKTCLTSMHDGGDFYSHECTLPFYQACKARFDLVGDDGTTDVLRAKLSLVER